MRASALGLKVEGRPYLAREMQSALSDRIGLWGAFALGCENTGFNTAFVNFSPTDRSFGFYRADIRFVAEYLFLGPSKVNIC